VTELGREDGGVRAGGLDRGYEGRKRRDPVPSDGGDVDVEKGFAGVGPYATEVCSTGHKVGREDFSAVPATGGLPAVEATEERFPPVERECPMGVFVDSGRVVRVTEVLSPVSAAVREGQAVGKFAKGLRGDLGTS
jgi:hypothetical protein